MLSYAQWLVKTTFLCKNNKRDVGTYVQPRFAEVGEAVVKKFTVTHFTLWESLHETIYLGMFFQPEFQVHLCDDHTYNKASNTEIVLEFSVQGKTTGMVTKFTTTLLKRIWLCTSTSQTTKTLSIRI